MTTHEKRKKRAPAPASLADVVAALETIAPLDRAAPWDNAGLIVAPAKPRPVRRALLAIDATPAVLDEALAARAELLIAYHPPLFQPLRRLDGKGGSIVALRAAAAGLAIYSPHTALDAAKGGINDWFAHALDARETEPIEPHSALRPTEQVKVVVFVPEAALAKLRTALADAGAGVIGEYRSCSFTTAGTGSFEGSENSNPAVGAKGRLEFVDELRLEMVAPESRLSALAAAIRANHPYEEPAWEVYRLVAKPSLAEGAGRKLVLKKPRPLAAVVADVKRVLGVTHARLARAGAAARTARIETLAFCPGAGGSVLRDAQADLLVTGEMRHHDVLAALARGASVLLCEHAASERAYLPEYRRLLREALPALDVLLSRADRGPLEPA